MSAPYCRTIADTTGLPVGGKVEGLRRLLELGLPGAPAFAVIGARGSIDDATFAEVLHHYAELGAGPVAVRSSALGEDSEEASFAGQYDTLLNVSGADALRTAIDACLASADNERARAYRAARTEGASAEGAMDAPAQSDVHMTVVVQRMVDAQAAGVLFTADPVSGRRDWLVIDAVRGLGDALVSGEVTPDHAVLDPASRVVTYDCAGDSAILPDETLRALAEHARTAASRVGVPLDLEWAIDQAGQVVFLQARPITHLAADPRALDVLQSPTDYYTKCNIGEMMPGAITPLSRSLTARGIEVGMQRMNVQCGALPAESEEYLYVAVFSGHMFLNLTAVLRMSGLVAGSTPEQACLAICGQRVPDAENALPPPASALVQYRNLLRYARFILTAGKRVPTLQGCVEDLARMTRELSRERSAAAMWTRIDAALPAWFDAFEHHLACSAPAGAMAPIMLRVTAENDPPDAHDIARVAELLSGARDVESADIAAGIDRIVTALAEQRGAAEHILAEDLDAALGWLRGPAAGHAGALFRAYLERHGHRAVRELELHQRDWSDDPLPLVRSIRSTLRARTENAARTDDAARTDAARTDGGRRASSPSHAAHDPKAATPRTSYGPRRSARPGSASPKNPSRGLRMLVARAHDAVRLRETTKSLLVKAGQHLKHAYRTLGAALVREGHLPDDDAVFFLTHQELRRCLDGERTLTALAVARRKTYAYQMDLVFEEIFVGRGEPVRPTFDAGDGVVLGKPVSVGVARGRARVVRTLEEASAVEAGEILIAPITDVGWTPYFGLLGGLATDVGSAVSHGAVVAREYGVPCIVGTQVGTRMFRTGDRVELDGSTGRLRLLGADE